MVLRTGFNLEEWPAPTGQGGLAASETREEIGHVSYILGECSGKQMVIFPWREALHDNNSRRQILLLLLCLVWSWTQQGQSEMLTHTPTLGTHRDRPLAGLQQERAAKFKALTNTKMGLRSKRRMNFVFWGSSGCPGDRLLN